MEERKANRTSLSIKYIIIILFILLMFATVGSIGAIIFSNWWSSTENFVVKIAEEKSNEIFIQVEQYMNQPKYLNEMNQGMLANNIVNIHNQAERERFFVEVMKTTVSEAVYSFSYGTEDGEYYGARINDYNQIEIMRNNKDTKGESWYYAVGEDNTAGELIMKAGKFDPRTRDWYLAAKNLRSEVFSPVYKHFIKDDLAISAAYPIHNEKRELLGVLGAHITLTRIDKFLEEIVKEEDAFAVIIEKDSGQLVSNSKQISNFDLLEDGTMKRNTINEMKSKSIKQAYIQYKSTGKAHLTIEDKRDKVHVYVKEFNMNGINWLVISGIPEAGFMTSLFRNIYITIILTIVALLLSTLIYFMLTNKFLRPINDLILVTDRFSMGDFNQRAQITSLNEVGKLALSYNHMADTIKDLLGDLEYQVNVRGKELMENREQLSLILDSTAEGIYGMDQNEICTFCNASCLNMLGYNNAEELIGKNVHSIIHHSYKSGKPMPIEECKIHQALLEGRGTHCDDEVFWKADGTSINVEYYSYPQIKDNQVVGAVVTFTDNTERKKKEEQIRFLSYHDSLTGLYNRAFFEASIVNKDCEENLPITVIYCDLNGLKLTNDIFGHYAGDILIKKTADILRKVCNREDIIARVGGDEFAILISKADDKQINSMIDKIKQLLSMEQIKAIKCSISIGYDTKFSIQQDINQIINNAEHDMYKHKLLNRQEIGSKMIQSIIETVHAISPREKKHSESVRKLCKQFGEYINLSEPVIKRLEDAAYLHDIGKITLEETLMINCQPVDEEEEKQLQQHVVIGYRILNLFEETLDLSEIILSHHERWDGNGYPKGLKGEEIPKLSRIIAIVENYDTMINDERSLVKDQNQALAALERQSGIAYDPQFVALFIQMIKSQEGTLH